MIFSRERLSGAAGLVHRRARRLAASRSQLMRDLVNLRKQKGYTQQDVADKLGLSQATVAAFEHYDNDPKLSTIHRYALAVGATVDHRVVDEDADWRPSLVKPRVSVPSKDKERQSVRVNVRYTHAQQAA